MVDKNGDAAFPLPIGQFADLHSAKYNNPQKGMSLRDYFAAKATGGLLSAWGRHDVTDYDEIAHDAYLAADAMLRARKTT